MTTFLGSIQLAYKTLDEWTTLNPILLRGQVAVVYVSEVSTRIKVGDGVRAFNDLPFADEGAILEPTETGAPFKMRLSDSQVAIVGNDTVITDPRLLGKTDYPVNSTQLNNSAFRDEELIYNPGLGKVTIKDFILMAEEFITLYPDGVGEPVVDPGDDDIENRLTVIEAMLAPFKRVGDNPGGGAVLFMRPANEIPLGWQEVEELRGKFPLGMDPTVAAFDTAGKTGGSWLKKLVYDNIPSHYHYTVVQEDVTHDQFPSTLGRAVDTMRSMVRSWFKGNGGGRESYTLMGGNANFPGMQPTISPTSTAGRAGADQQAVDLTNPFRIVHFIRFAGI